MGLHARLALDLPHLQPVRQQPSSPADKRHAAEQDYIDVKARIAELHWVLRQD